MAGERERITILMMRGWDDNERSYSAVVRLFNDTYSNRRTNKSTVLKTIERFKETSSIKGRSKGDHCLQLTKNNNLMSCRHLLKIPILVLIESLKLMILLPCRFGEF